MEAWEQPSVQQPDEGAVMAQMEANIAPEESQAPLSSEEMDAVIDELVAIASRMAVEQAATWSGRDANESEQRQLDFARSLLTQEDSIRQQRPDFDLEKLLREEGAFRALILAGESVERALAYIEPEAGAKRVEMEVIERIKRRNARPQPIGTANRQPERSAEERLSEEEMGRIDAQLKRGHKVYLNY